MTQIRAGSLLMLRKLNEGWMQAACADISHVFTSLVLLVAMASATELIIGLCHALFPNPDSFIRVQVSG